MTGGKAFQKTRPKQRLLDGFFEIRRHLLHFKRLTVGALIHGRVLLVSADQDAVQGTVVFLGAVMFALLNGTLDAAVGLTMTHVDSLLLF